MFCGGSERRCLFCVEATESVLVRRQQTLSQSTGWVSQLCPRKTPWEHSCCFPQSWIQPLAHSSYQSSSNTGCLTSASSHDRDLDLFIKILPEENRSASPCFTLICLYNHPCCLDEGLISMLGILLCARSLYSSRNFEDIL